MKTQKRMIRIPRFCAAASARMTEVYGEGVDIISRIEAMIKR